MAKLLTNEGYLLKKSEFNKDIIKNIKKDLTVCPYQPIQFNKKEGKFIVFSENEEFISVPKFYGLKKFGEPDKNYEKKGIPMNINFKGKPKPKQEEILKQTIDHIDQNSGGLICAGCGQGKTFMALYIANHYKVKTLIIVHKTFLLNQWIDRINEFTDARVGIIQQNKVEVDEKDFVVGMLQSIAKDKYESDIFSDFGMVIFDEAHHAPSEYFSKALPIISCKRSLALSATPKRSDKMEKVLFWFLGDIAYKQPPNENKNVLVKVIDYTTKHKTFKEYKIPFTGDINRPKTLNKLVEIDNRNKFIIENLKEIMIEKNRKVLLLSDRIEHLKKLKEEIDLIGKYTCDFYIGGRKQKDLDNASECQILLGSYGMASEGLDIPTLNTLIMTTPRREVEQSIGRITRKAHKIQPLVIDFTDNIPCFKKQGEYRQKLYKKLKYNVKVISVNETEVISETDITNYLKNKIDYDERVDCDFIDD
jgi:superfamily II DNA or RNA helicase